MGFFSSVAKVVTGAAKVIAPAAASYFGGPIAGAAVGSILTGMGAQDVNSANALRIQQANAFSQASADKQMAFQTASARTARIFAKKMSSTAYQRGMADMRKAGLNPMLAYKQGGASSPVVAAPTGASAKAVQPTPFVDEIGPAVASGWAAQQSIAQASVYTAAGRLGALKADDYKNFGDSILGRQAASAWRMGGAVWREFQNKNAVSTKLLGTPRGPKATGKPKNFKYGKSSKRGSGSRERFDPRRPRKKFPGFPKYFQ